MREIPSLLTATVTALVLGAASPVALAQSHTLAADIGGFAQSPLPASIRLDPRYIGILPKFRAGEGWRASDRNAAWTFEVNRAVPALEAGGIGVGDELLDSRTRLVEAIVGRRLAGPKHSFEFLGGIRFRSTYLDLAQSARERDDNELLDSVVSGRFTVDLSDRLHLGVRGDVTGLGFGSRLKFRAAGLFGYRWKKNRSAFLGYRAFGFDFSEGSHRSVLTFDFRHKGPMLGLELTF